MLNIGKYLTIFENIDNTLQYYSVLYRPEQFLTISNNATTLLLGLTSLAVLKLYPYSIILTWASPRGAFAPKNLGQKFVWSYEG